MKANDSVVDQLKSLLAIKLTAVNEHAVQAEMCKSWGFDPLCKRSRNVSLNEMGEAYRLIQHILYWKVCLTCNASTRRWLARA